ncbi:MAG: Flp pilus assembly protein CpaB, partial [Gemmataceae bacterium]
MRASTMFAMTLALLSGLGAVVAARYAGWLGKPEAPKEKEITVLAAARNLFPGDLIDASYVKTRALKPEERAEYEKDKASYLPAVPAAASMRVASKPIEADAVMRRQDLQEMVKPDALNLRLLPNMRAVNISVQKENSAGGLIQEGEWVDVYLTTVITAGDKESTRTAPIATSLRVIAKRNALWRVLAPLPDGKPVNFTVEANPYRAALLEYGKAKGTLTLAPLSASEQKTLEERRTRLLAGVDAKMMPVAFGQVAQDELTAEEARVDAFTRGSAPVGTADLVRIFDISTPPPPRDAVTIERFNGLARASALKFSADGEFLGVEEPRRGQSTGRGQAAETSLFQFNTPGSNCKTCK